MEVRQDAEWVLRGGLWLAGGCHGTPAPPDWPPTYTDKPKQGCKMSFCASNFSETDSNKSEFIFLHRSPTAHKKGRIYFYFFPLLLLTVLSEAEMKG